MPGIPLVVRETTNSVCNCSYSRGIDHMCRQEPRVHLSPEELAAAEESLSVYCKPVELYNILRRRAIANPLFLQRNLHYKLQAKNRRRLQVSVSAKRTVAEAINNGLQTQSLFPLYILLARLVSAANLEQSAVYRFSRAFRLTDFREPGAASSDQAKFILPEINKLSAELKSGSIAMLVVSCVDIINGQGIDLTKDHMNMFSSATSNFGGYCLLGKLPMDELLLQWERGNLSRGNLLEMTSNVSMQSCFMKLSCSDEEKCVSFRFLQDFETVNIQQEVPISVSSEELGAKDASLYELHNDIRANSSPLRMRLRTGNVIFNYKYYNNLLQRTEVTEDFSCPFCLVKCASYKGLRLHVTASHDLFCYEFWVNEDYQVVIVSVKTELCTSEIIAESVDPKQETFFFCHKPIRRWKPKGPTQNANHVHPLALDSDVTLPTNNIRDKTHSDCLMPSVFGCAERDTCSPNATGVSSATGASLAEPESAQSIPGSNLAPPAMLQFAKTRKLSVERSDPRNRALLQKRQFFHSHRAQPMALEQVFAERDSEDEVDDDVADLEDRRMLDDFVDVTKDEKQMMHLWNSFVRKQRVLADGHIPWACEAFSKLHGKNLVRAPALLWCWRLFMVKLWNHGLLDPRTMNNCNIIFEKLQIQMRNRNQNHHHEIDPTKSER